MTPEEEKLNKAMDEFVEDYEFDNKLMTRHIYQMAFFCVIISGLIVWLMETYNVG